AFDSFGYAVAAVGPNVLVGAPFDDTVGNAAGAAYLFDGATGDLRQMFTSPAPSPGSFFGSALAPVGSMIAIGAPGTQAVYLFDASGRSVQTLSNPFGSTGNGLLSFGEALAALGSDAVLVGDESAGGNRGAAYLFDAATGTMRVTLERPHPAAFSQ